jgi:hypothetical protein
MELREGSPASNAGDHGRSLFRHADVLAAPNAAAVEKKSSDDLGRMSMLSRDPNSYFNSTFSRRRMTSLKAFIASIRGSPRALVHKTVK